MKSENSEGGTTNLLKKTGLNKKMNYEHNHDLTRTLKKTRNLRSSPKKSKRKKNAWIFFCPCLPSPKFLGAARFAFLRASKSFTRHPRTTNLVVYPFFASEQKNQQKRDVAVFLLNHFFFLPSFFSFFADFFPSDSSW